MAKAGIPLQSKYAGASTYSPETPPQESEERFRLLVDGIEDYAIFQLDPTGHIISWNAGAQRLKGYTPAEIIGRSFETFYPQEAIDSNWPQRELEMARERGRFEDEGWRLRKDGSRFWANVVITSMVDRSGRHLGFSKVTRDLTERRAHEETLRQSEERFRLMVESVRDYAIFMLNPDGTVATWNAGAERIKGYRANEIVGRHFSEFYPEEARNRGWPAHELEAATRDGRFEDEGWRVRKDGSQFWANVVITALRDPGGGLRGFAKVTRDLTEKRQIEALETAKRQNTEFLAMLAHELRNPLAPIHNALGIMRLADLPDPEVRWSRDVIERQTEHLTRLVDDLLDVSRLTSGKVRVEHVLLEVDKIVFEAVEAAQPLFRARGQEIAVATRKTNLRVLGDSTRLHQVLLNLLNNASKYSAERTHARLTVDQENDQVVIRLRDEGMGIPPELLDRVFDLFVQAERSLARSEGGLGLGLTLVRQLTQLHGGTVEAHSEGLGKGAEFVVRLPVATAQSAVSPDALGNGKPPAAKHLDHSVLVVDDNRDSADTIAKIMTMWGYTTRSLYSGTEVRDAVAEWKPRTVLLDVGLPGQNGFEVLQRLQAEGLLGDTLVVAMTGYGGEDDRARIRDAGFAHHFVKPVDLVRLRKLLERQPA